MLQSEAPQCDSCGHILVQQTITETSENVQRCLNCGDVSLEKKTGPVHTFFAYTERCKILADYPDAGEGTPLARSYCINQLCSEAGEAAKHFGKALRDDGMREGGALPVTRFRAVLKELGDVTWYVDRLAVELGSSIEEVINMNLKKLESRKARGVLKGDGDDR